MVFREIINPIVERSIFLLAIIRLMIFFRQLYRRATWLLVRSRLIKHYMNSHQMRMLQVGAGRNILGNWLNTDQYPVSRRVIFMDATKPFPLENSTFDFVFSEHQIEHLTYNEGLSMLRECYRVLKPGGRIRIATPDLETLIALYTHDKTDIQQRYVNWIIEKWLPYASVRKECFVINNAFRHWWHKFIYDRETLRYALESVGFTSVTYYDHGESDDKTLRGIESHGIAIDNEEINRFETMVLEGERPIMDYY